MAVLHVGSADPVHFCGFSRLIEAGPVAQGGARGSRGAESYGSKAATYGLNTTKVWMVRSMEMKLFINYPRGTKALQAVFSNSDRKLLMGEETTLVRLPTGSP